MKLNLSNSLFIVFGIGITVATIVLLYTILVTNENPNNKFKFADRIIINDNAMRYTEDSDWGSEMNYKLIKDAIHTIDLVEAKTIYAYSHHQRWISGGRYKSYVLFSDHGMADFINFTWLEGGFFSEEDVLNERRVVVLSEKSARETFGTTDVIGKFCDVYDEQFKIIGVYKDLPYHTFPMDEIVPITTDKNKDRDTSVKFSSYNYRSLIRVKHISDIPIVKNLMIENSKSFEVQPEEYTLAIYPYTIKDQYYTDRKAIYKPWSYNVDTYQNFINSLILIFILAVICLINVTNLTITNYLNRNIELGVRISFGANWRDMLKQSVVESFLYFLLSFSVGVLFSYVFIEILNRFELYTNYTFALSFEAVSIVFIYACAIPFFANFLAARKMIVQKPIALLKGVLA